MKLKVGIFGFTGCAGCQLMILNLEDELLDIFKRLDVCAFPLASSEMRDETLDVAFVEGSITTEEQRRELEEIRERSKILVAIGNCATLGGVQAIPSGLKTPEERLREVYGEVLWKIEDSKPLSEFVKVDAELFGCPIEKEEFVELLRYLLRGYLPPARDYPVCLECKFRDNECLLLKGEICLGALTVGGCKARCPSLKVPCLGCRGVLKDEARIKSAVKLFEECGVAPEDVKRVLRIFSANYPDVMEVR
ncbi:MAG: sulfhydrogenase subunit delta [Archaeoglobi archaeon]|nr:sulfhydrogenase subunit delta [Archaeoglobi archaeon]